MAFCDLSVAEARRLEVRGEVPDCRSHRHVPGKEAEKLIADQGARAIGRGRMLRLQPKEWAAKDSVMQLLPIFRDKRRQARGGRSLIGAMPRVSATLCRDVNGGGR